MTETTGTCGDRKNKKKARCSEMFATRMARHEDPGGCTAKCPCSKVKKAACTSIALMGIGLMAYRRRKPSK